MTREEAIRRIKAWNLDSDDMEVLAVVIPELVESDDEKIREEMIRYFTEMKRGGSAAPPYDDCIAYLKQKEYKLTEEDKKIIPEALVMLCDDIINHRVHTPIKTDEEGARKIKAFLKTFNKQPYKTREEWEKQKEQKPNILQNAFDKSKKDYTLEEKSKASDYAESILPTSVMYGESEEEYKLHTIIEAAFIAGQKEQKPADEAEKFFDSIESYNQGFVAGQKKMKEDIEKGFGISEHSLDYLAGRYAGYAAARQEQKSAEWSEEDSTRYISIGRTLGTSVVLSREDYDADMSWLRGLVNAKKYSGPKPSWKPSEEQPKMNIPSAGSGAMGTTPPKFKLDVKQDLPVGLEKEIQEYLEKLGGGHGGFVDDLIDDDLIGLARHFYELGKLNARKEE